LARLIATAAALAPTNHGLDDVAEKSAWGCAVAQFAHAFEVFPGNLERFLKLLGKRDDHGAENEPEPHAFYVISAIAARFPSSTTTESAWVEHRRCDARIYR
jgi:hypothetical protein